MPSMAKLTGVLDEESFISFSQLKQTGVDDNLEGGSLKIEVGRQMSGFWACWVGRSSDR